jgi:hypothetical protein
MNKRIRAWLVALIAFLVAFAAFIAALVQIGVIPPFPCLLHCPSATPIRTLTPSLSHRGVYDFENGTQGWRTFEIDSGKPDVVKTNSSVVHSGRQSLQITTVLSSTGPDYNRHSEAEVDFYDVAPVGIPQQRSYDLSSGSVSCYVFLPSDLATSVAYLRIEAKDNNFAKHWSDPVTINASVVQKWTLISLSVGGDSGYQDPGFNPKQIYLIGVKIDVGNGSSISFSGSYYIDDCSIQY